MRHGLLTFVALLLPAAAFAQGVSTSAIRGRVVSDSREIAARIEIRNDATGFSSVVSARDGRFLIRGLEPGGPYSVTATAIGYVPSRHQGIMLDLGERVDVAIELRPASISLDTLVVTSRTARAYTLNLGGGSGMSIDTTILERMPTLNRDIYDFIRLAPQVSTKISLSSPGVSAGGVGFRFNNFLINGISDRTLSGNVSNAFGGLRSIPLDAVREYQVLISPYDVRYGDFAGALVNAVTRSGGNKQQGSAFVYVRNDDLARRDSFPAGYQRVQYGMTTSGPVIKDGVHYLLAGELQKLTYPAAGSYIGQPPNSPDSLVIRQEVANEFISLMKARGLNPGTGGRVQNSNPQRNLFGQVTFSVPSARSHGALWVNFSQNRDRSFARTARDTFSLTSSLWTRVSASRIVSARLNSSIGRSGSANNELLVSHRAERLDPRPAVLQPTIRVSVPGSTGGQVFLNSGTQEFVQDTWVRSGSLAIKDIASFGFGAGHSLVAGAELERFSLKRGGLGGTFGTWTFSSLQDFAAGTVDRYDVRLTFGSGSVPLTGSQYSVFAGDEWTIKDGLAINAGIRADMLALDGRPPYEPRIDSLLGRRTDIRPRRRVEMSPRIGVAWHASEWQTLRGGAGIFTSRYPLAWIQTALSSYGVGGTLSCRRNGGFGPPPAFNPDHASPPLSCAGGRTITPDFPGEVDLIDPDLRMMRVARASLAQELRFKGVSLTSEALWTSNLSDFVFMNLNLKEPIATDLQGRVIYGVIGTSGAVTLQSRTPFVEVIDVRNTSHNHSYQLSTRLEKSAREGLGGSVSYTFSRVRDVQTPVRVNTSGRMAWAAASVMSGRHDELKTGISANDIPHRIVLQGVYAQSWFLGRTDFAFYYVGESGRPFTYVAFGTQGGGDLNGDRAPGNDPVYVPLAAADTSEIHFTGISDSAGADNSPSVQTSRVARQAAEFESFISRTSCLKSHRGRILPRNACREPWSNTTIASARHGFDLFGKSLEIQIDAFNVLNVINSKWGSRRETIPSLLEHVGQTQGTPQTSKPVFRFSGSASRWTTLPVESSFQFQFALRYRF